MTFYILRRQGNSLGFTLPSDEVKRLGLHPGDLVDVHLTKINTIASLAGILKGKLGDIQELLHEMDEEDRRAEDNKGRRQGFVGDKKGR